MKEKYRRGLILLGAAISAIMAFCFSLAALVLATQLFFDGFSWRKLGSLVLSAILGIMCYDRQRRMNKLYEESRK